MTIVGGSRALAASVIAFLCAGCVLDGGSKSDGDRAAVSESAAKPEDLDLARLIDLRLAIPTRPKPPAPPRVSLREDPRAKSANVVFNGSRKLVTSVADAPVVVIDNPNAEAVAGATGGSTKTGASPPRVAVLANEAVVGMGSAAGMAAADVLYVHLQNNGLHVADRDYRILKRSEVKDGGELVGESVARRSDLTDWDRFVDYYIVVHNVPGGSQSVAYPHRREIDDAEWTRYEQVREAFLAKATEYNRSLDAFDTAVTELASRETKGAYVDSASGDAGARLKREEKLRASVEGAARVVAANQRRRWEEARANERVKTDEAPKARSNGIWDLFSGGAEADANDEEFAEAARTLAHDRMTDAHRGVFATREQAVGAASVGSQLPVTTRYQASLSVRAIRSTTYDAEWFGVASAEGESYVAALDAASKEIAAQFARALRAR